MLTDITAKNDAPAPPPSHADTAADQALRRQHSSSSMASSGGGSLFAGLNGGDSRRGRTLSGTSLVPSALAGAGATATAGAGDEDDSGGGKEGGVFSTGDSNTPSPVFEKRLLQPWHPLGAATPASSLPPADAAVDDAGGGGADLAGRVGGRGDRGGLGGAGGLMLSEAEDDGDTFSDDEEDDDYDDEDQGIVLRIIAEAGQEGGWGRGGGKGRGGVLMIMHAINKHLSLTSASLQPTMG